MAEENVGAVPEIPDDEPEETPGYQAPAKKTLDEIQALDADDESLVRYKQLLLKGAESVSGVPADSPNVVVEKMVFVTSGRDDIEIDLTGDLSKLKDQVITIKEGANYKLKIVFKVQREIVAGLRYHHVVSRKGIRVDKVSYMVGSYGPKAESQSYTSVADDAPSGMLARGSYKVKSKFLDDDKVAYLEWEWFFDIKKDWN